MRRTFSFTERFLTIIQILPHFIETRKEVGYVTCPKSRRANRAFDPLGMSMLGQSRGLAPDAPGVA